MTCNTNLQRDEPEAHGFDVPLLAEELKQVLAGVKTPFSMPGHRAGRGLPVSFNRMASDIDTTELPGTDNLQHPQGILKAAQERAAVHFGAVQSHFLVNGSTVGLLAMLMAVAGPGDEILVGRDCHRSVLNAIQLAGADPVFVGTCMDGTMPMSDRTCSEQLMLMSDRTSGEGTMPMSDRIRSEEPMPVPGGPSESEFLQAIQAHPRARALLLTRPNYYGVAIHLDDIACRAHEGDMVLLVDEAHGAHFICSSSFPKPALLCGADLVVQSLHKTLPSPTQTAILHEGASWRGVRPGLPVSSVREALSLFQTTSPSYPLLAGIDAAVRWASGSGREAYRGLLLRLDACRAKMEEEGRFRLVKASDLPDGLEMDPTRLVIPARNHGMQLEAWLREKHGLFAEMADLHRVVLIATPFHDETDFAALIDALRDAPEWNGKAAEWDIKALGWDIKALGWDKKAAEWDKKAPASIQEQMEPHTDADIRNERVMPYQQAIRSLREQIPLHAAAGRISAGAIIPYPPGVAAIVAGEVYGKALVSRLLEQAEKGISLLGVEDGCVSCIMKVQ